MATKKGSTPAETGVKVLNTIRAYASKAYQDVMPVVTKDTNLQNFAKPILSSAQEFVPIRNEFVHTLINRIAFTIIEERQWNNRLAMLKKGYVAPLGFNIQHTYTNPINPRDYDGKNLQGILSFYENDTKVAYYSRNIELVFPISVSREQLAGAFVSWTTFNNFISNLVTAVHSGAEIREYNDFKRAIVSAVEDDRVINRFIEFPTENNAKQIVKELRTVSDNIEFPSSAYNTYAQVAKRDTVLDNAENITPVVTWTPADKKVIIMRTDILETLGVEVLASAFHMTEVEFRERLIKVDDFGFDIYDTKQGTITGRHNSNLGIVIADEALFQFFDNLEMAVGDFLGYSLTWQYFLHKWQTIGICPFANCVTYSVGQPNLVGINADNKVTIDDSEVTVPFNFVPDNYSGEMEITAIKATKDGSEVDVNTADTLITAEIEQEKREIKFTKVTEEQGTYIVSFNLHAKDSLYPNIIINVTVTVASA